MLCLYQHVSEPYHKLLSKAFIQRSDIPHQRLSKQHLLFEIPEIKYINTLFIRYTKKTKTVRYEYVYVTPLQFFFIKKKTTNLLIVLTGMLC